MFMLSFYFYSIGWTGYALTLGALASLDLLGIMLKIVAASKRAKAEAAMYAFLKEKLKNETRKY